MAGGGVTGLVVDLSVRGRLDAAFAVPAGAVVAVVGPNGAGKSTLLGALAGALAARGTARLGDVDLMRLPAYRREVGLVFQDRRLFPHLSALDNVAFGLRSRRRPRKAARATAMEWLERLGVAELAGRRATELSGGQAQRVAIARALVTQPRLLLLDEPFTGLATDTAEALRSTLATHLSSYDGTTLVVTHDDRDVAALAERTLTIEDGRIVGDGGREPSR